MDKNKNKKHKTKSKKVRLNSEQSKNYSIQKSEERLKELEAEIALESKVEKTPETKNKPKKQSKLLTFWIVLAFTVILAKLPFSGLLFTPLNQFATMIHELSHAIMCILTGGSVSGMTIVPDGQGHGGLTMCRGGIPFIHVQAGYLGTTIVGCFLVFLGQFKHLAKSTLTSLGVITALTAVVFMGAGLFSTPFMQLIMSILWAILLSAALVLCGKKLEEKYANFVLLFLAFHISMDSLKSIGIVISSIALSTGIVSDATIMQKYYFLPAIFWSLSWAAISIILLGGTFWLSYKNEIK